MTTSSARASLTVAITGASGLVGGNLAELCLAQGMRVRATKRASSRVDHLADLAGIEWHDADLDDREGLERAFDGADCVFHCAAIPTQTRRMDGPHRKANIDGTRNVVDAVRAAGAKRLVHCSSVVTCAIARAGERDVIESDAWNFPAHGLAEVYSITKRDSEQLVIASDVDAVVVNPGTMFGPRDAKPSTGRMIIALHSGRIFASTSGWSNFVDVRDVCRGMLAAFHKGKRGERYILGGENLPYTQAFALVCAELGRPAPRFTLPDVAVRLGGAWGDLVERVTGREQELNSAITAYSLCAGYRFSSDKARAELGYTTSSLRQAVRDAIAWFRARGQLPTVSAGVSSGPEALRRNRRRGSS